MEFNKSLTIIQKRKNLKTHILEGIESLCRRLSQNQAEVQFEGDFSQITCEACKNAYERKVGTPFDSGTGPITNTEKARKLYGKCEVNWEENLLIPYHYKKIHTHTKQTQNEEYVALFTAILINHYAQGEFYEDWVPFTREMFYITPKDKGRWKAYQRVVYKLTKKRIIETMEKDGKTFIRLVEDGLFDSKVYELPVIQ